MKQKRFKNLSLFSLVLLLLLAVVTSCKPESGFTNKEPDQGGQMKSFATGKSIPGKFSPPDGKQLFIIGQDNDTIQDYLDAVPEPQPAGFTSYTSLQELHGLHTPTDYGAGLVFLDDLVNLQQQSVISLGLYMVDFLDPTVSGTADENIDQLLDILMEYDRPVFLRFGYEFDGSWNHYDPQLYKKAWIYFRTKMQQKGVDNVAMVWQSAAYSEGTTLQKPIEDWYPGDEYVDWIGLSYFTQVSSDTTPLSNVLTFARQHNKPVMIAEASPQRYATGNLTYSTTGYSFIARSAEAIWQEWYAPFFAFIYENDDVIRAVAYINTNWDSQPMWAAPYSNGYWGDSRVQANDFILDQWLHEVNKPTWLMASPDLYTRLGYQQQ